MPVAWIEIIARTSLTSLTSTPRLEMKITEKIKKAQEEGVPFHSFEYFPPKTNQGVQNLIERLSRMAQLNPTFVSFTWGAGGSTFDRTIEMCATGQGVHGLETLMHLTCTNMGKDKVDKALKEAKEAGVQSILALRGDPPRGQEYWSPCDDGFTHAVDLVRHIRSLYGDYFCIGVAGYPEGHIDAEDIQKDRRYLKEKVDAGADFIITQLFYDVEAFRKWERECREDGIVIPIIPGIMPIHSYQGFRRITNLVKSHVPKEILDDLEVIKNDDEAVKDYGVRLAVSLITSLQQSPGIVGFHLSTLNLEKSVRLILERLGLVQKDEYLKQAQLQVAGKIAGGATAAAAVAELLRDADPVTVKPLIWKTDVNTSLGQVETWDEFPNGRWGDARSPAYGEALASYGISLSIPPAEALRLWSYPTTLEDITTLFTNYILGRLPQLPWCDELLQTETDRIRDMLTAVNRAGMWTVSSQPAVDGVKSEDEVVGWGPKGGYVYQKPFIEFFVSPKDLPALLERINKDPSMTYHAANRNGDFLTNVSEPDSQNAVTWGVFPGKEIVQSTIIERVSFEAWKDEAYALWAEWERLYQPGSASRELIAQIGATYWLCNVVHNDLKNPEAIFEVILGR